MDSDKETIDLGPFLNSFATIFEHNKMAAYNVSLYICVFMLYHLKEEGRCKYIDLVDFICKDLQRQHFEDLRDLTDWVNERSDRFLLLMKSWHPSTDKCS